MSEKLVKVSFELTTWCPEFKGGLEPATPGDIAEVSEEKASQWIKYGIAKKYSEPEKVKESKKIDEPEKVNSVPEEELNNALKIAPAKRSKNKK